MNSPYRLGNFMSQKAHINLSVDRLAAKGGRGNRPGVGGSSTGGWVTKLRGAGILFTTIERQKENEMNDLFVVRIFAYSVLPLLLASGLSLLDRQSGTRARRIELFVIYLLAISVGANGLSGAFGHLFLSDLVAEGVGWETGSPFQLEMGFANLLVGVLGLMAVGRRDGFRTAAILATTILGVGATSVHLWDIAAAGNLSPGNTIQNIGNLLDPALLIGLTWLAGRINDPDRESAAFLSWQMRQQPIAGMAAAGVGIGFGIGFAVGGLLQWTLAGALAGVGIGILMSRGMAGGQDELATDGN